MRSRSITSSRVLLWLYLPTLALSVAQGMIFPAIPKLADAFAVSAGTAGQVVTAFGAGRMAILVPAGLLVDTLGSRTALLLGSSLALVGALAVAASPAFWGILAGQVLSGAGASLWTLGREAAGLEFVPPERRGRLLSAFFGLQMAGNALGPVAAGLLVDRAGLQPTLWVPAAVSAGVWVLSAATREDFPAASRPARPVALRGALGELPRAYRPAFAIVTFSTFVLTLYRASLNALLPLYVGSELGYPGTVVGSLFGVVSVVILLFILPAGILLDRMGRKWGAVPACLVPAAAYAVMPTARSVTSLAILAVLFGVAGGLSLGSMSALSYDVIPEHARGRLQALRRLVGEVGGLVGPLVAGLASDLLSPGTGFLLLSPLLLAAGLLLAFRVPETLRPEAQPRGK
ncbi:MAG: MFS transporter [Armatimonadota bacterium]|nr:MFS transporter [Armatimonadota bacterium]MDW8155095.1 MFS transporter [Armatimonadota bacterium]